MTTPHATTYRARMVRDQLEKIDSRLTEQPPAHPLVDKISQGHSALTQLIAQVEDPKIEMIDKVLGLQAIGSILARHGETPTAVSFLTRTATAKDQHPSIRAAAGRCLLVSKNEDFCAAFETRLASPTPAIAASAAQAMGIARRASAVEPLIELFAKTKFLNVQSKAAWALGEIGSPRALEILTAAFQTQHCLVPVIEALGKLGDEQTIAYLTVTLRDTDPEIRFSAAEAIHKLLTRHENLDHKSLVPYLLTTLEMETIGRVGVVLISCLQRLEAEIPTPLVHKILSADFRRSSLQNASKGSPPSRLPGVRKPRIQVPTHAQT